MSTEPFAARGLALHASDHAIDQRGALELGENAEHLDHHPARCSASVEGFCSGAKADAGLVELLQQLRQRTDRPAQTVDSIDEEHVVALRASIGESLLQARALQSRAAHLVRVAARELPVVLTADV